MPDLSDLVLFDRDGHVATVTINRPEKLNAVTVAMGKRIRSLMREVNDDDAIRCLVLKGAGDRAFCVGTDIRGLGDYGDTWQMRNRESDYALDIYTVRKPVIAAIHGFCIGGGLEMAINADIRIASPSAQFSAGEIKLGWHGGSGMTQFLPRLVGYGKALQMILTGDIVDATEAHRIGLADECVPEQELGARAAALAARIASYSPIAVEMSKHSVRMSMATAPPVGLAVENDSFTYCMTTEDSREGISAFLEKRDPVFRGR